MPYPSHTLLIKLFQLLTFLLYPYFVKKLIKLLKAAHISSFFEIINYNAFPSRKFAIDVMPYLHRNRMFIQDLINKFCFTEFCHCTHHFRDKS